MPYKWDKTSDTVDLTLWPHRSMSKSGFKWFMGSTLALISVPLISVLGTVVLWGLLPFFVLVIGLLWFAIERNDKDLSITETLSMTQSKVALVRQNPRRPAQTWDCQTYWARLNLHPAAGPVPNYLTLSGNGREVELGAFLTEEERLALYDELRSTIDRLA